MSRLRRSAMLLLLAALVLPVLALMPPVMHSFDVPKSTAWEPLALLAAALAWAASGGPFPAGTRVLLWPLWAAWLAAAAWAACVTWLHRLSFGIAFGFTQPGDALFRSAEALAALNLAWAARKSGSFSALHPLPRLALSLAGLWCLAAAFSIRPDAASPTLLDWCGYLLVFAAAWSLCADRASQGKVLAAVLFGAALNALYGLMQSLGLDPVHWAETFDGRASGFFGNPNFLGGHLALALPLALALALDPERAAAGHAGRWAALARWALVWLLAAGLLASQTRGAWVGAAAGCVLALAGFWARDRSGFRRARGRVLAVQGLLLLLGLGAWWLLAAGPQAQARIEGSLNGDREAARRAFLMAKTGRLALQHPLLGVGPGNYRIWFPSVEVQGLDPQAYATQPYIISEHGHNDFLQMAADAGWAAALLWACLLGLLFVRLARGLARAPAQDAAVLAGTLGALVALAVHGLANFPFLIVPTQGAAWAVAAVGLRVLAGGAKEAALPAPAPLKPADRRTAPLLLASLLLAGALLLVRARQLVEDGLWWRGSGELSLHHAVEATPLLLKATGLDVREDRVWALHGRAHFERGNVWQSIGSLREAHALNPWDAQVALELGQALIENRLYDEAWTVLSSAVAYAPNLPDLWEPLAAAAYQDAKYADAVQAYDWMLYFHIHEEAAYTNKAAALGNLGRLPDALAALDAAEQAFPSSGKVQLNLAITLYKMGLRKKAHEAWSKAAKLTPSDPQVDSLREVMRP